MKKLLLISLFFLPLISSASTPYLSTGPKCYPDDVTKDMSCPYDFQLGSASIPLKWNATGNLTGNPDDHYCFLACTDKDGKNCSNIYRIVNNYATTTQDTKVGRAIYPNDDALLQDPIIGNTYRAVCVGKAKSAQVNQNLAATKSAEPEIASGKKITITGTRESCEIGFIPTVKLLSEFQKAPISEVNFNSWGMVDYTDFISYRTGSTTQKTGSGDLEDIENFMIENQTCTPVHSLNIHNITDFLVLDYLKLNSNNHDAAPLVMLILDNSTEKIISGHALIELSFNPKETTGTSPNHYDLEVLDPNIASIRHYDVQRIQTEVKKPGIFVSAYVIKNYGSGTKDTSAILLNPEVAGNFPTVSKLKSNAIRKNTADYLRQSSNYPKIENFSLSKDEPGFCAGWSDFILRVAYLGDFVGYDYHPNDGKYTKTDCDEVTHYPISPKTSQNLSQNWLSSVFTAWQDLIKFK